MELTIKDKTYPFRFGIAFMRDINTLDSIKSPTGIEQPAGFAVKAAGVIDGNLIDLCDMLIIANKTENPKISRAVLEDYLDDEDTDIDAVFKETVDFLSKANACKTQLKRLEKMIALSKAEGEEVAYPIHIED